MKGNDSLGSSWCYALLAAWHHPEDGVKVGAILGLLSLVLALLSVLLGGLSIWLTV
jgi:hypothetical protein